MKHLACRKTITHVIVTRFLTTITQLMSKRHALSLSCILLLCIVYTTLPAQDSSSLHKKIYHFPEKVFGVISLKSEDFQKKLTRHTQKYLTRIAQQERRLRRDLWKTDSSTAKVLFADVDLRYAELIDRLHQPASGEKPRRFYSAYMDSMTTAIRFLGQNNLLKQSPRMQQQLNDAMQSYDQLHAKLNGTDQINRYLRQRQKQLEVQLGKWSQTKQFRKFQKDVYYYRAQVDEYKKALEDPQKLEARLLQIASALPAFRNFFARHSEFASLFRLPGNSDPLNGTTALLAGLQTRTMVQQYIQQRLGTARTVGQVMQQSSSWGKTQPADELRNRLNQLRTGDVPTGFRPNRQKTKRLLDRIDVGTNFQSTRSNSFLPVSTDIGLGAGYKINDNLIAGVGAVFKLGWGRDLRHISISYQGIGLRSFVDYKLKGSVFVSGGYEQNYRREIKSIAALKNFNAWQASGLVGITKKYYVSRKLNGNMQLLWDFLSYSQKPMRTQAVLFRVGYIVK